MSVDSSMQIGFLVDWGLCVLAARWFAALSSASPAVCCSVPVVLPSLFSRGGHPGFVFSRGCAVGSCANGEFKMLRVLVVYMGCKWSKLAAAAFSGYLLACLLGGSGLCLPFISPKQTCQVDYLQHGAVGSLPVQMEQAFGRVDVPDGTKIEAWYGVMDLIRFMMWWVMYMEKLA